MDAVRVLKSAIVAQWLLIVAGAVVGLVEERFLPELLRIYIPQQDRRSLTHSELVSLSVGLFLILGLLIASLGIFRLRPWAGTLYVACLFIGALVSLFLGPVITSPIEGMLEYFANGLLGFTVAMLYFSNAHTYFESTSNPLLNSDAQNMRAG